MTAPLHACHGAPARPERPFPGASHGGAWQQQMERAQAASWFHRFAPAAGGPSEPPPTASGGPGGRDPLLSCRNTEQTTEDRPPSPTAWPPAHLADPSGTPLHRLRDGTSAGSTIVSLPAFARAQPLAAMTPVPPALAEPPGALPMARAARASLPPAPAVVGSEVAPGLKRAPTPPAPVRVHVEESAAGLRVWVGLDGAAGVLQPRAAALLSQLRQGLGAEAARLETVVVNGATLYRRNLETAPREEPPWPLT